MPILKIRNVTELVILSNPAGGEIANLSAGEDIDLQLTTYMLETLQDQITTYVDLGHMTYTVEGDPDIDDDLEGSVGAQSSYSVEHGLRVSAGTTPSTIADYNLNMELGEAYIKGVSKLVPSANYQGNSVRKGLQLEAGLHATVIDQYNLNMKSGELYVNGALKTVPAYNVPGNSVHKGLQMSAGSLASTIAAYRLNMKEGEAYVNGVRKTVGTTTYNNNSIHDGLLLFTGTTPSGAADYNLDFSHGNAHVNSVSFVTPGGADFDYKGEGYTIAGAAADFLGDNTTCIVVVVIAHNSGTPALKAVYGAPHATTPVAPTPAEITASLTTALADGLYVEVGRITVARAGAAITETITQTRVYGDNQSDMINWDYCTNGYTAAGGALGGVVVSADGDSRVGTVILAHNSGTPVIKVVFGAQATDGSELAATTAEITTALTTALADGIWIELGQILVQRVATDTIVETFTDTRITLDEQSGLVDWDYIDNGVYVDGSSPVLPLTADGKTCWVRIVAYYNSGTPGLIAIFSAEEDDGDEVLPTNAEVTTAVGESTWVEIGRILVQRTSVPAAGTMVETFTDVRPIIGELAGYVDWDYLGNGLTVTGVAASALSADGQTYIGALVLYYNAGSPAFTVVFGAAAADGAEVAPTAAQITTAVGEESWFKLATIKVQRVLVNTITETFTNIRPIV